MKAVMNIINKRMVLLAITIVAFSIPIIPSYGNLKPEQGSVDNISIGGAYVVFAGKSGGEIRKSELTAQTEVGIDGCAKDYKIIAYTLEITSGKSKTTYQAHSNQLTKEMKTKLHSLAKGDVLEFKSMKAQQNPDKHIVDVHGSKFTIV